MRREDADGLVRRQAADEHRRDAHQEERDHERARRPSLSPMWPKMMPPRGRTRNATAKVANAAAVSASGSPSGRRAVRRPARPPSRRRRSRTTRWWCRRTRRILRAVPGWWWSHCRSFADMSRCDWMLGSPSGKASAQLQQTGLLDGVLMPCHAHITCGVLLRCHQGWTIAVDIERSAENRLIDGIGWTSTPNSSAPCRSTAAPASTPSLPAGPVPCGRSAALERDAG